MYHCNFQYRLEISQSQKYSFLCASILWMEVAKNDRVRSKDGFLATVKYVGYLTDIWGEELVVGVEWDKPERGKNSGDIKGKHYFQTEIAGAGSFLKLNSGKLEYERLTFAQALLKRYGKQVIKNETITFGTKTAENYGFDKLGDYQAHFETLLSVSLDASNVAIPLLEGEKIVVSRLKNLKYLDISFSLVNLLKLVWEVIDCIPTLEELSIGGNRFFDVEDVCFCGGSPHELLKILRLPASNFPFKILPLILKKFPNIEEVSLAGNGYQDSDLKSLNISTLNRLDLSFNKLTTFPSSCSNIPSINLEGNLISSYKLGDISSKSIDLRGNKIADWEFLDQLSESATQLTDLRINRNPLFEEMSIDEMTFLTMARFKCGPNGLESLNGSQLKKSEIHEAELYFISQVRSGRAHINQDRTRWREISTKHNIEDFTTITKSNISELAKKRIQIRIRNGENVKVKQFLIDNTVLRLKGVVARLFHVSVLDFELYYFIDGLETQEKQHLDDDIALLDRFSFRQGQEIFVSFS